MDPIKLRRTVPRTGNRLEFHFSGICCVRSRAGRVIVKFKIVFEPAYNSQYPIPISRDGRCVFIGTYWQGLFCYDLKTGEELWRAGPGRVRTIKLVGDCLIAEMDGRGIFVRDARDGSLKKQVKMTSIRCFYPLAGELCLAGPQQRRYFIFEMPHMRVLYELPSESLNPYGYDSFCILGCRLRGRRLTAWGWETNFDHSQPLKVPTDFKRMIDLERFGMHGAASSKIRSREGQ